jgi:hypothetical protein
MIFCLANTFSPLPWPIKSAQCSLNSLFTGNRLTRRIVKSKYHTCRARHFGIAQAMEKNAATTQKCAWCGRNGDVAPRLRGKPNKKPWRAGRGEVELGGYYTVVTPARCCVAVPLSQGEPEATI